MTISGVTIEGVDCNSILQKDTTISQIDHQNGFQICKFYNYLNSKNDTNSDSNDELEITSLLKVYLKTGKFAPVRSINITITTNSHLCIDKKIFPL